MPNLFLTAQRVLPRLWQARGGRRQLAHARRRRGADLPQTQTLESRQLLSVSLDANGWMVAAPSPGARVIYVSSSSGSDSNPGLSPAAPVKSLHHAESLLQNGSADEMLLECGNVWNDSLGVWTVSGRSAADPIVVGSYGSGARPLLETGAQDGVIVGMTSARQVNYVDFIGLDFSANARDPGSPDFTSAAAETGCYGFYMAARTTGLTIEDCRISDYATDISVEPYFGSVTNLTIRRSEILDAYSANGSHSEGLYANGVQGLVLQGNVFDHDGWNASVPGAEATIFNHDAYLSSDNSGVVVTDNIFADASSHGLQARSGGDIESNLFLNDPIGMSFGLVNGSPVTPGGVSGIVNGNVFIGAATINGQVRGYGMEIGNTSPGAQTIVSNNIFSSNSGGDFPAIMLEYGQGVTNPTQAVGINDLNIRGTSSTIGRPASASRRACSLAAAAPRRSTTSPSGTMHLTESPVPRSSSRERRSTRHRKRSAATRSVPPRRKSPPVGSARRRPLSPSSTRHARPRRSTRHLAGRHSGRHSSPPPRSSHSRGLAGELHRRGDSRLCPGRVPACQRHAA